MAADGWVRVADSTALGCAGERIHVRVEGRYVSVIRGRGASLFCIDSICYHTGGPLAAGDIEDIEGETCVRCPWHRYDVRLADGARPYQAMKFDPATKQLFPNGWKYTMNAQRTHEVEVREGPGTKSGIWIRLSSGNKFESDQFAYNENAAKNISNGVDGFRPDGSRPHAQLGAGTSAMEGGYKRSGEVLAELRASKQDVQAPLAKLPACTGSLAASSVQRMHSREWRPFRILSKRQLSSNMWLFRFALPSDASLGSDEVERHLRVRVPTGQQASNASGACMVERQFTPVSPLSRVGSFDIAVKIYKEGALTQVLDKMIPGDSVEMCGPHGELTICWSELKVTRPQSMLHFNRLVMLAAGSGITPMLQILQDWLSKVQAGSMRHVKIDLLYANRCEEDIAFREELVDLSARAGGSLQVLLALSRRRRPDSSEISCAAAAGRPGAEMLERWLGREPGGQDAVALVCGPQSFNVDMAECLANLSYRNVVCL